MQWLYIKQHCFAIGSVRTICTAFQLLVTTLSPVFSFCSFACAQTEQPTARHPMPQPCFCADPNISLTQLLARVCNMTRSTRFTLPPHTHARSHAGNYPHVSPPRNVAPRVHLIDAKQLWFTKPSQAPTVAVNPSSIPLFPLFPSLTFRTLSASMPRLDASTPCRVFDVFPAKQAPCGEVQ